MGPHIPAREDFVKKTCYDLSVQYPNHNIMVAKEGKGQFYLGDASHRFGSAAYWRKGAEEVHYTCTMVRKGTRHGFRLHGDGGFWNWCFMGNFEREGNWVTFL